MATRTFIITFDVNEAEWRSKFREDAQERLDLEAALIDRATYALRIMQGVSNLSITTEEGIA